MYQKWMCVGCLCVMGVGVGGRGMAAEQAVVSAPANGQYAEQIAAMLMSFSKVLMTIKDEASAAAAIPELMRAKAKADKLEKSMSVEEANAALGKASDTCQAEVMSAIMMIEARAEELRKANFYGNKELKEILSH